MSAPSKRVIHFGLAGPPPGVQFPPGMTTEVVHAQVTAGAEKARQAGYEVQLTFVDAENFEPFFELLQRELQTGKWDALVIGGGIRLAPACTPQFERVVNLAREVTPRTKILFQTAPGDMYDVVQRGFE